MLKNKTTLNNKIIEFFLKLLELIFTKFQYRTDRSHHERLLLKAFIYLQFNIEFKHFFRELHSLKSLKCFLNQQVPKKVIFPISSFGIYIDTIHDITIHVNKKNYASEFIIIIFSSFLFAEYFFLSADSR